MKWLRAQRGAMDQRSVAEQAPQTKSLPGDQCASGLCAPTRSVKKEGTPTAVRLFASGYYKAGQRWGGIARNGWSAASIAGPMGMDVRYVVTASRMPGPSSSTTMSTASRGKAELSIRDHKLGLGSGRPRSPCQSAKANQLRLLLHSARLRHPAPLP